MSWDNKVVWSEGLFLRPQHLQQSDRYVEKLVRSRTAGLRGYGWGLTHLRLNRELLSLGKVAIEEARGVLEDGTPFSIPEDAEQPIPLEPPENARDAIIYLALPAYQPGAPEVDRRDGLEAAVRLTVAEQQIVDSNADNRGETSIEVGKLRFRLLIDGAERAGFVCLGIARMVEMRADKQIVLDETYIPPVMDCAASKNLANFVTEVQGLLHHRGEALGGRVSESGTRGAAEISDFLLLQAVNRYEPIFAHLATASIVHPEALYGLSVQLAGELTTFTTAGKRPPAFPVYKHDELAPTYAPVMRSIRQSLSAVLEQTAVPIPLQERKYGIHVAPIMDRTLLSTAGFVLAVKADIPAEHLRQTYPSQVKIGPVERIRELVNVALPGISLQPLPVAPRQIPYHAGVTYFELDRTSALWKSMDTSGGLALHVAGDFPGLEMALWAIRGL
ncbi:MAG TPA: type VI secretion system baseplate subunit TssK [Aliidongia sp.]|nr:type VI secretion system baseplate subunit TssK [Aliidongia sp.]